MIKRVFGRANDFEIVLEKKAGQRWEATLPSVEDGRYIIELWAEDEAGNMTYMAKAMIVIHAGRLKVYIVPDNTGAELEDTQVAEWLNTEFDSEFISQEFDKKLVDDEYEIDIIMPGRD